MSVCEPYVSIVAIHDGVVDILLTLFVGMLGR